MNLYYLDFLENVFSANREGTSLPFKKNLNQLAHALFFTIKSTVFCGVLMVHATNAHKRKNCLTKRCKN